MRTRFLATALCAAPLVLFGCDDGETNVLGGVQAIAYIQLAPSETGNVFDYTGGAGKANIFTLTPPTASGVKKNLTNWTDGDVNSMNLSFDARELVFSGRAPGDNHFHIYRVNVDGSNPCDAALGKQSVGPCQITEGPYDEVYPIYQPGGRIFYVTNKNVEGAAVPQFRDEYERSTTAQAASMNVDGSDQVLGARNVSHRVAPTLLADGRVLMTEWRHLGDVNDGDLVIMNQDLTGVREAFGREGSGLTNSYLRAKELSPGKIVTIGTSRDRTFQSGKILLVDLGGEGLGSQSEARASAVDLTPDVPGDRTPSFKGVGRYYDVQPFGETDRFLVSWSDGAVESEVLAMAKASPDFGIYVYDAKAKTRSPVVNEIGSWEVSPLPIVKRPEPAMLKNSFLAQDTEATLISAINVYDSTIFRDLAPGAVKKVRISEGFSSEEGFPNEFGLSEFDGMARLGDVDVSPDGSFKALVPANTPVRMQLLDKYGMAVAAGGGNASEPVWIQGRAGEARVCGGCHEDRTKTIQLAPGSSALQAVGAKALDYAGKSRQERLSAEFTEAKAMGVPWNQALQPIFDQKCVGCHDGSAGAANPSYTLTDPLTMETFSFTFDLSGREVAITVGEEMYAYAASYVSLLGPEMALRDSQVMVTMGELRAYVTPGSAAQSDVIRMLNPPARWPAVDLNDRAYAGQPVHPAEVGTYNGVNGADAQYQLTPDEYYMMILMADSGGQYYSRENAPGGSY